MCFGIRSPATCWHAAPICGACNNCSAMPDIGTTQIYTHVLDARLQTLVRKAHPLARMGRSTSLSDANEK